MILMNDHFEDHMKAIYTYRERWVNGMSSNAFLI